jgi:uncharacterized protein YukE
VGEIAVRPAELLDTAAELDRAAQRLSGVTRALAATDSAVTGDGRLAAALDGFRDEWQHGLGLLGETADVTAARLREAARAYVTVDDAVASACS